MESSNSSNQPEPSVAQLVSTSRRAWWTWWTLGLISYFAGVALVGTIPGDQAALGGALSISWPILAFVGSRKSSKEIWQSPMVLWATSLMLIAVVGRWFPSTFTAVVLVIILIPGVIAALIARAVKSHGARRSAAASVQAQERQSDSTPTTSAKPSGLNWKSRPLRLGVAIAAAIILLISVIAGLSPKSDDSISPIGIGGVRLGMTKEEATNFGDVAYAGEDSIQYNDPEFVWAYLDPNGRVNNVVLEPFEGASSGFTTAEGIGLESSIADFQAAYPGAQTSSGASAAWTPLGPNAILFVKYGNGRGRFEVGDRDLIQRAFREWETPEPIAPQSEASLSDSEIQYRMEQCEQERIASGDQNPLSKIVADCYLIATRSG